MRHANDLRQAYRLVWVNTYRTVTAQAPFGGVRDSGFGRKHDEQGLLEFTTSKNVTIDFSDHKRDPIAVKAQAGIEI